MPKAVAPVAGRQIAKGRAAGGFQRITQAARLPIGGFGIPQTPLGLRARGVGAGGAFRLQVSPGDSDSEPWLGPKAVWV